MKRRLITVIACLAATACETTPGAGSSPQARFQLVTSTLADAENGSIGSADFYNNGAGYALPGPPDGDRLFAFDSEGETPGRGVLSMSPQVPYWRSIRGDDRVVCFEGRPRSEEALAGYAKLQPASFRVPFPAQPTSSTLLMTLAVEEGAQVRMLFRKGGIAPSIRLLPTSSDSLALEIADGAVSARRRGASFTASPHTRRLVDFPMRPPASGGDMVANLMTVELDAEAGTCTVRVGGASETISDPDYCDPSDHRDLEIGISVVRADTQRGEPFSFTCFNNVLYTSR